jgi:DDE superfamily endonuclease
VKQWCVPTASARFVAKMEDVLAVYARPYDPQHPVVCVDEAGKELHGQIQPLQLGMPGQIARQDYEYVHQGSSNLFLWVEPLAGRRGVRITARRTRTDFAEFLRWLVEEQYARAERVVLVTDNLNTHGPWALYETLAPAQAAQIAEKIEWHYTPEHGSWLNMAEIELSVLRRQCLNRRIGDRTTLAAEVAAWQRERNHQARVIDWQFTTAEARIKLKRLYPVYGPGPTPQAAT